MKAGKILKYLVLAVVAINLVIIAIVLLGSDDKPEPMPNPNGYDDFVRAGKALAGGDLHYTNQTKAELDKLVAANTEAWKLLQAGLQKECLVPNDYSRSNIDRQMDGLAGMKSLIFLVVLEGKAAEANGQTNDALHIYLDGFRYADHSGRGGVIINKLVDVACEAIVMPHLQSLKLTLDAKQCAEAASALEKIDAKADSVETVLKHEKEFSRKVDGLRGQFTALIMYKTMRVMMQKTTDKMHANMLHRRQAMVAFAARAYELEKGKAPASVEDLTPQYLKAVPKDPVTGLALPLGM